MVKLQEQIAKKRVEIASYGDTGKYGTGKWNYYTVRTLKEELKELYDKEIQRLRDLDKRRAERVEERWVVRGTCQLPGCCKE